MEYAITFFNAIAYLSSPLTALIYEIVRYCKQTMKIIVFMNRKVGQGINIPNIVVGLGHTSQVSIYYNHLIYCTDSLLIIFKS